MEKPRDEASGALDRVCGAPAVVTKVAAPERTGRATPDCWGRLAAVSCRDCWTRWYRAWRAAGNP
jgi:hypothetical protein